MRPLRRFVANESGQSSLFAILTLFLLLAAVGYVYNVSMLVSKRIRLQNAADAAAMSGAIVEANALSAIAWLNGCQTYIHARMQEIMLDIPYTATAAATAEWGRYVMNRYGHKSFDMGDYRFKIGGTRDKIHWPVEWNRGSYKIGILGEIKSLVNSIGAVIDVIENSDKDNKVTEANASRVADLLEQLQKQEVNSPEYHQTLDQLDQLGFDTGFFRSTAKVQALEKEREELAEELRNKENSYKDLLNERTSIPQTGCSGYLNVFYGEVNRVFDAVAEEYNYSKQKLIEANTGRGANAHDEAHYGVGIADDYNVLKQLEFTYSLGGSQRRDPRAKQSEDYLIRIFNGNKPEPNWSTQSYLTPSANFPKPFNTPMYGFPDASSYLGWFSTIVHANGEAISSGTMDPLLHCGISVTKANSNEKLTEPLDQGCLEDEMKNLEAILTRAEELLALRNDMAYLGSRYLEVVKAIKKEQKKVEVDSNILKDHITKLREHNKTQFDENEKFSEGLMHLHNDPPGFLGYFKMLPIPVLSPEGPTQIMGRMTPLGTPYDEVRIGGKHDTDGDRGKGMERGDYPYTDKFSTNEQNALKDGMPVWGELVLNMAGPMGKTLWPAQMKIKYGDSSGKIGSIDNIDNTQKFLEFFHKTLLPEARRWIGHRDHANGAQGGVRPGETWIRQLSQTSAIIAIALPKLVRNEVLYSVSINASARTVTAIFPDPDDIRKWGGVSMAQTDAEAGEAFFRYDGWFVPPAKLIEFKGNAANGKEETRREMKNWVVPPNYVNMYTTANSGLPLVKATVEFNNRAIWLDDNNGKLYGNRFLNESRRQNFFMRTGGDSANDGAAVHNPNFNSLKGKNGATSLQLPLSTYVMLVRDMKDGKGTEEPWTTPDQISKDGYFRMRYRESFYWDEYAGRVGGDGDSSGEGSQVRVAVKCWNQNDRTWRAPKKDSPNNNIFVIDTKVFKFDGLSSLFSSLPIPIPFPGPGSSQPGFAEWKNNTRGERPAINKNLSPRCIVGFAPGSSVIGMGHAMFIPSHGNIENEDGGADGHWHYEHYHAHSSSCQNVFPGIAYCQVAGVNCIFTNIIAMPISGMKNLINRTSWDGTAHYPYRHWDGTVSDDLGDAAKYHIYCRIAKDYEANIKEPLKAPLVLITQTLFGAGGRRVPFAWGNKLADSLLPPFSLYKVCLGECPYISILKIINICVCFAGDCWLAVLGDEGSGLHGSAGEKTLPKDIMPLYNSPAFWTIDIGKLRGNIGESGLAGIFDMDPGLNSIIGANLTWGDLEGEPTMFLGTGDRFFYPEIFYKLDSVISSSRMATGRYGRFHEVAFTSEVKDAIVGVIEAGIKDILTKLMEEGIKKGFEKLKEDTKDEEKKKSDDEDSEDFIDQLFKKMMEELAKPLVEKLAENLSEKIGDKLGELAIPKSISPSLEKGGAYRLHYRENPNGGMGTGFNSIFTTTTDLMTRWGHHRFIVCPLCMSYCPIPNCDFHVRPQRHWGGDYGGATDIISSGPGKLKAESKDRNIVTTYIEAVSMLSIYPGLYATGDQQSDAGMSYNSVLRGHDRFPWIPGLTETEGLREWGTEGYRGKNRYNDLKKQANGRSGVAGANFEIGWDLDDGLAGNGAFPENIINGRGISSWSNQFPMDRFIRQWMSPVEAGDNPQPALDVAPTVVVTENFMRHGVTVMLAEEYVPFLWMFGKSRPLVALATAKCGFIERGDVTINGKTIRIDGRGVSETVPQIITGIGEAYMNPNSGESWDLDRVWSHFLDFPNEVPLGESNLYHTNWGAKLVPSYYGLLPNLDYVEHPRRAKPKYDENFQAPFSDMLYYLGTSYNFYYANGKRANHTMAAFCRMNSVSWRRFANEAVETAAEFSGGYR